MSISEKKFLELYDGLNAQQREAVDAIEGPVMVVAGPGTGKTQILTLRIANILRKTDIHPSNILALTFTESAASSMRRRLADIIGSAAYAVHIRTFHGFCNEIIRDYPEEFPRIIGATAMTDVEQIQMLTGIIDNAQLEHLKPMGDPHYYVRIALKAIEDLKKEGVAPADFARIVEEEGERIANAPDRIHERGAHRGKVKSEFLTLERTNAKQKELAALYALYRKECASQKRYDFQDMIMEVLSALGSRPTLLQMLQEQFQYILVDEHQDTNRAQNMVIELLASFHEHPNIFVVGDAKQAIYRFQGASLENFNYLEKKYPGARVIVLQENYRSSQSILDTAESLLAGREPLTAKAGHANKPIHAGALPGPEEEYAYIAQRIAQLVEGKTSLHEIAILYRDNRDAEGIARALRQSGIAYSVETDRDIFTDNEIRKFLVLLEAINSFGDDEAFVRALHIDFLNVPEFDIHLLITGANKARIPILAAARSQARMQDFGLEDGAAVLAFYKKLSHWSRKAKNENLLDVLSFVAGAEESGYVPHLLALPDAIEKLEYFTLLFEYAKTIVENKKDAMLADLIEHIETANEHAIGILHKPSRARDNRVRLMTAHKAKGLEFDTVFIAHAYDGHWSNKRSGSKIDLPRSITGAAKAPEDHDPNADERRLFYVAITRARKELIITYPAHDAQSKELLPCQFISEIRPELIAPLEPMKAAEAHTRFLSVPLASGHAPKLKDAELIAHLFRERGLAVTALNNYLSCPWKYFYTNLIRIPRAQEPHLMFGTAIHAALRDFFATLKNRDNTKEFLVQSFIRTLTETAIPAKEFERWKERGIVALSGYYDKYDGTWPRNVRTEFEIYGIELSPDVRLTGKLDKIEFLEDDRAVNVVDYKTGTPKSRGEIEGKTKSSNGDIKRQLIFYKLLLDRYDGGRYRMASGEIDFIEPDKGGKYHREFFEVTDEEVVGLEKEILRVADEIIHLKFWDSRCGEKGCEFCELRDLTA
jgi:DNA helicase-2/ATP-dependent DNA helicase PcrA